MLANQANDAEPRALRSIRRTDRPPSAPGPIPARRASKGIKPLTVCQQADDAAEGARPHNNPPRQPALSLPKEQRERARTMFVSFVFFCSELTQSHTFPRRAPKAIELKQTSATK